MSPVHAGWQSWHREVRKKASGNSLYESRRNDEQKFIPFHREALFMNSTSASSRFTPNKFFTRFLFLHQEFIHFCYDTS